MVGDAKCDAPPVYQSGDANANAKLDLTETWTYTCSTSNVLASFQNLATAKGTPPVGPDVTDQDTAEVVVIHPAIKIVKSPDSQTVRVGDTASFTLTVTNTGDVPLSNAIVVGDAKCDAPPVYQGGDANANAKLDLTETWTYTCSTSNVLATSRTWRGEGHAAGRPGRDRSGHGGGRRDPSGDPDREVAGHRRMCLLAGTSDASR